MKRKEERSSSNRPELAACVLALRGTPVTKPMLCLSDNQALLKAVKRCVGEGPAAKLVAANLLEAIEVLSKRTIAGAATFLVKVKAHRGELANEVADIAILSIDFPRNGTTGQIEQSSSGKSLARKEILWAMKIRS